MTVSAVSNNALLDNLQTTDPSAWQTRMQQALGPVAQLFGENAQQLSSDLQSGQTSLSALAQSKGISQSDLLGAIQQGLQQSSANGGPALSSTQMTNLSSNIANRVHGHHHHHGGGGGGMSAALSALSGSTDTSATGDTTDTTDPTLAALGITNPDSTSDASLGSSSSTSSLQTDAERILFQLQTAGGASSTTGPASPWSNTTAPDLLAQMTQFDQTV